MVEIGGLNKHQQHVVREKDRIKKSKDKSKKRKERNKSGLPKGIPHTLETLRHKDETFTNKSDQDLIAEHDNDEFTEIYQNNIIPKILVTHSDRCCPKTVSFSRWHASIKKLIPRAHDEGYSAIIIFGEDKKKINNAVITHLPAGPTFTFKITNVMRSREFRKSKGKDAKFEYDVIPQLLTLRFMTRVGLRVERSIGALFPPDSRVEKPKGHNRTVVFHNQRDYIFFRHYRYQHRGGNDENDHLGERVITNEIGPRFTMKLLNIQQGTFDTKFGDFEWCRKRKDMDNSRRSFVL